MSTFRTLDASNDFLFALRGLAPRLLIILPKEVQLMLLRATLLLSLLSFATYAEEVAKESRNVPCQCEVTCANGDNYSEHWTCEAMGDTLLPHGACSEQGGIREMSCAELRTPPPGSWSTLTDEEKIQRAVNQIEETAEQTRRRILLQEELYWQQHRVRPPNPPRVPQNEPHGEGGAEELGLSEP